MESDQKVAELTEQIKTLNMQKVRCLSRPSLPVPPFAPMCCAAL